MKIAFTTLGCKVNQYETQAMRELCEAVGYTPATPTQTPDVFVINSCTVTAESDRKTRQAVRHYRRLYPDAVLVLTGCMAQAFPDKAALTEADVIMGNTRHASLPELVRRFLDTRQPVIAVSPHQPGEVYATPPVSRFDERTRAYMKIEDGCTRYCSYCIIPTARGRVRSKPLADIQSEATALADAGFCEIVLVGINLSAYGQDNGLSLADAVETVAGVPGIKRIRLGSLEPDHMSDELLYRLADIPAFCPQFHLSLQSGCSATLKRMNRHYDAAFYRDLADRIRHIFPQPSLTTDVMVGFAGETPEEFKESLAFVKEMGFAKTHVFAYSRRAGTVADKLPDQVTGAEKSRRSRLMIECAAHAEQTFLDKQIGVVADVLFETAQDGVCYGYTKNYCRVALPNDKPLHGQILSVRLIERHGDTLFAVIN